MTGQEYLRTFMQYDPLTGICTWIPCSTKSNIWNGKYPGKVMGSVSTCRSGVQYLHVGIDGDAYMLHRIIWLYMKGDDVPEQVDHWDGNGLNNKWVNLREADSFRNAWNSKGPAIDIVGKKYRAKITCNYHQQHLGMFDTYDEALAVCNVAATELFGEYARCNRPTIGI